MEKELALLRSAAETAQQAQALAEQDCEKHKTLAMQSRDNYDREHTLHNATISELAKAKEQRDALQSAANEREAEKDAAVASLETLRASVAEQRSLFDEQVKSFEKELESEREHNKNLMAVVTQLQSRGSAAAASSTSSSAGADVFAEGGVDATPAELLQVVRHEKHEADVARAKLEEAGLQVQTLEQRCNFFERQLGDAQKALHKERERALAHVQSSAEHAELLKKVETLDLLHDSNAHLRDEKQRLEHLCVAPLAPLLSFLSVGQQMCFFVLPFVA
jgi:nucleoprotein TPR